MAPAQTRRSFRHPQASPIEPTRQHGEDRTIYGCESGPLEMSFQNEDLVAQRQDLCVSSITTYQQQSHTCNQKPEQVRKDR
jgi:hypothetical protein